jgi:NNP family nitrate/nitrite transporter-like MFS transporter
MEITVIYRSIFKQMPTIFERRQAGGVIGWTAAIAVFGPFFFGVGIVIIIIITIGATAFYAVGVAWAAMCVAVTWIRYARRGAPRPS